PFVVDVRHARLERVAPDVTHLAGRVGAGRMDERPVVHDRLAARLAVDRPRRPVIVRVALFDAVVHVGEDAEAELRIFVEDLALWHVVADVCGDERVVLQDVLDDLADLLAPRRPGLLGERALTGGAELLQSPAHRVTSSVVRISPYCAPRPAGPQISDLRRGSCALARRRRRMWR